MRISFTYKKYLSAPSLTVEIKEMTPDSNVYVDSAPSWLKVINSGKAADGITHLFTIGINPNIANNLSPGIHDGTVRFAATAPDGSTAKTNPTFVNVTAEIIDNVVLTLSKTQYNFTHTTGQTPPVGQPLSITTENAWSIVGDQPWLTFSKAFGTTSDTTDIGVDVTGMAVGVYEATFQVDDGSSVKQGNVSLVISGTDESGDYLDLSRTTLSFSEIHLQTPSRSASVEINTSLAVTVSTAAAWLDLSAVSFPAGVHQLSVAITGTEAFDIGNYTATILVESGYSSRTINVLLRIVEVESTGIESGKLYFAKDRNTLVLTSSIDNAEALLDFKTPGLSYSRRVPYFNGVAQVVVGLETNRLQRSKPLPNPLQTAAFSPVTPLVMDFTVFDKVINSTVVTQRQSYAQLNFLNGRRPEVENILTTLPPIVTVPAQAVICFSFYSEDPVTSANITGAITETISFSGVQGNVYTVMINLSTYALKAGDHLQITSGPVTRDVVIKPTELATFRLIWLNEWDCPEVMNMDGLIEIMEEEDSSVVTVAEAGREIERVIDIKEPCSFKVGTGNIYSDAEVKWLAGVLRSRKMWLEIAGQRTEVISKTSRLSTFRTREFSRNFTLNFDAAIR